MQQRVYECRMNSVDELKLRLIDVWNSLQQNVIDAAINEWRKRIGQLLLKLSMVVGWYLFFETQCTVVHIVLNDTCCS